MDSSLPDLQGQITDVEQYSFAVGGYGDIFRGKWIRPTGGTVEVAIKVFRGAHIQNTDKDAFKRRVEREYRIWASLEHPNILPLYGMYTDEKVAPTSSLVSPYREDRDVIYFISRVPNANKKELIQGIVSGLLYLHSKDIIHGDMKPQNIIVHRDGEKIVAELGDFGGARGIVRGNGDTTVMKSTPRYVAPEVLMSEDNTELSKGADIYSLGMVMLHILSGQIPFVHIKNDAQLILAVMTGQQPKRKSYSEELISDLWWSIMTKCWAKSPSDRPRVDIVSTDISNM